MRFNAGFAKCSASALKRPPGATHIKRVCRIVSGRTRSSHNPDAGIAHSSGCAWKRHESCQRKAVSTRLMTKPERETGVGMRRDHTFKILKIPAMPERFRTPDHRTSGSRRHVEKCSGRIKSAGE